jgi:TPR repeat protein
MKKLIINILFFKFIFFVSSNFLLANSINNSQNLKSKNSISFNQEIINSLEEDLNQTEWFGMYLNDIKIGYMSSLLQKDTKKKYYVFQNKLVVFDEGLPETTIINEYFDKKTGKFVKCLSENFDSNGKKITSYETKVSENELIIKNSSGFQSAIPFTDNYNIFNVEGYIDSVWIKSNPKIGSVLFSYTIDCETGEINNTENKLIEKINPIKNGKKKIVFKVFSVSSEVGKTESLFKANGDVIQIKIGALKIIPENEQSAMDNVGNSNLNVLSAISIDKPIQSYQKLSLLNLEIKTIVPIDIKNSFQQKIKRKDTNTFIASLGPDINFYENYNKKEYKNTSKKSSKYPVKSLQISNILKSLLKDVQNDKDKVYRILAYTSNVLIDNSFSNTDDAIQMLKNSKGDCTEHAILFTTLARAAGIPAREASGLIYNNEEENPSFNAHAWAEVALDGKWVAVDPMWREIKISPIHIKLDKMDYINISSIKVVQSTYNYSAAEDVYNEAEEEYNNSNFEKAYRLYYKLAKKGDFYSQYYIGWANENGKGITQDYKKALKWFLKAASQGDDVSEYHIAQLYEDKKKLGVDYNLSSFWFERSAIGGNRKAAYFIAEAYKKGLGVPKDNEEALAWYQYAAEGLFDE